MPVAPPASVQNKRYLVADGDTLSSIARRVQGSGANASAARLAEGIQALNPQIFGNGKGTTLKVGQSLLLPDTAIVRDNANAEPEPAQAAQPQAPQLPTAEAQRSAEQLAVAAIENQQLNKGLDDLKVQVQTLQEQLTGKDRQIIVLQTQLSEQKAAVPAPSAPIVAPAPVKAATPPVVEPQDDSWLSSLLPLAILVLLLLIGLAYSVRRNRRKQHSSGAVTAESPLIKPAQVEPSVFESPAATARIAPSEPSISASRPVIAAPKANAAPDALDGVSIYIAYGRFAEALGILRGALEKEPQRIDIRSKILELLAEQGDAVGFAREEQSALDNGVEPQVLADIRTRYPQLKPVETPTAAVIVPVIAAAALAAEPEPEPAQLDETAAAALNPVPGDEFQLNLDDLSMDADWDLVDPFDTPKNLLGKPEVEDASIEEDLSFSSNLSELPEVFEIQDDQFLSDFSEPEQVLQSNNDTLDDDFLNGFMDDSSEFDLLDLDEAPLSKINQAQVLIDDGDIDAARELLQQVMEEADEDHQQMARELLSGIS
jgi:FimV-like protein